MDMSVIINQMIILFILMGIGFSIVKLGLLEDNFNKSLSTFIINVSMPALIISSVVGSKPPQNKFLVLLLFGLACLSYFFVPFIGWISCYLLSIPKNNHTTFIYMMTFSNTAFIGFPVIQSIFGEESIFYTAILNLAFNLFNYSLGISLMSGSGLSNFKIKKLCNPGIFAAILALAIYFLQLSFPAPITGSLRMLGSTTSPLAMIVIGMNLAKIPLKSVFTNLRLYPFALIKLIGLPLLAYPLIQLFVKDTLVKGVLVISLAMPVATSTILFANEFNKDTSEITRCISLTTLLSMASIPFIAFILFR